MTDKKQKSDYMDCNNSNRWPSSEDTVTYNYLAYDNCNIYIDNIIVVYILKVRQITTKSYYMLVLCDR